MFIVTATQMNRKPITVSAPWFPVKLLPQSASSVAIAVAVSVPPSQIGLLSQYRTPTTAPAKWPYARRTQS